MKPRKTIDQAQLEAAVVKNRTRVPAWSLMAITSMFRGYDVTLARVKEIDARLCPQARKQAQVQRRGW